MNKLLLTTAIALTGTSLWAEGVVSMDAELSFSRLSANGNELDITSGAWSGVYEFGPTTVFGTLNRTEFSADGNSESLSLYGIGAEYLFNGAFGVGGELTRLDAGDGVELDARTIYGIYESNGIKAGIGFGQLETDGDEEEYTTVFASYDVNDDSIVGFAYFDADGEWVADLYAEYNTDTYKLAVDYIDTSDLDGSIISISGDYEVFDKVFALGEVSFLSSGDVDITSYELGAGYELYEGGKLFATVGRIDAEGQDIDTVSVGYTFDIGKRKGGYQSIGQTTSDLLSTVLFF